MEIEPQIEKACSKYAVPLALARAVCMYESGADGGLVSGAGARGYYQVMPATFRLMAVPSNIEAGVKYLSLLLQEFGREDDAVAAYNGGPGRLKKGRRLPIETLQYVVGVGSYRTLLTFEEAEIRAEASKLELHRVGPGEDWEAIAASSGMPVLELRLYNPYLAVRPLRPGLLLAHPSTGMGTLVVDPPVCAGPSAAPEPVVALGSYATRRGDNYLLLALAFGVEFDRFRADNALWRVQVPFEGMRLLVPQQPRTVPDPLQPPTGDPDASIPEAAAVRRPARPDHRSAGSRAP